MSEPVRRNWGMIFFGMVVLWLLFVVVSFSWHFSSRTEYWSEDVALQSGSLIKVKRKVDWTTHIVTTDPFFGLPIVLPHLSNSWPDKFWLEFEHPQTHERIQWQGIQYFRPVLLDIVDGTPYLVLWGHSTKASEKTYGCAELPYIYLKYDPVSAGNWRPISVEAAPKVLRNANLSPDYPDFGNLDVISEKVLVEQRGGRARRDMSLEDIQKRMPNAEHHSGGSFQSFIPRTYDEWRYMYKNNHLNERKVGDCRPPRPSSQLPPPVVLPVPVESTPEILKETNYTPDRVAVGDDWSSMVFDQKRARACKKLFRPTDLNDYMQGQRFINDNTGSKPVPYSRSAQFDMGVRVLCDSHVWFITHQEVPGKMVISKFTLTGDLVYRTSFRNPKPVEGFIGYIRVPSLRVQDGYLYFDWLDFRENNPDWHIKRQLEMRIREPAK